MSYLDQDREAFDALPEHLRAPWRWIDATRAAGGLFPEHPSSLEEFGWTWEEFAQAIQTYRNGQDHERLDEAVDLMQEWLAQALASGEGERLVISGVSWCFANQEVDDGEVMIYVWPTAAPALEFEGLDLPTPSWAWDAQEGMWQIETGEDDPAAARRAAWEKLSRAGFCFDAAIQKDPRGTAYAHLGALEPDADEFWRQLQSCVPGLGGAQEKSKAGL